jgi:hypothetical protein
MPQVTEQWRNAVGQAQRMSVQMQAEGPSGPAMQ